MGVPATTGQLLILVTFVLPGVVYQVLRSRLRGPTPHEPETSRLLRAAAMSTFLALAYLALFGDALLRPAARWTDDLRETALLALLLVFAVPSAIALVEQRMHRDGLFPRLRLHGIATHDPTPAAWDHKFGGVTRQRAFVRVLTADGRWVGGLFDRDSFASSFPHPRDLSIETQYEMSVDGAFGRPIEESEGVYVRCDDARVVEFVRAEP